MLPQANRLRLDKDIKALFAKGKGVFGVVCGIKFRPNGLPVSRFAVVVGLKVSKKAVVRNRLRRQIRAMLRHELDHFRPGYDLMILVRPAAVDKKPEEIKSDLLKNLKKTPVL